MEREMFGEVLHFEKRVTHRRSVCPGGCLPGGALRMQMTRHEMARCHLSEAWDFLGTDVHGVCTTRVKFTTLWGGEHITHRPRDGREILCLGIQARDRVEETNRIRVQRVGKQLVCWPQLDQM